MNCSKFWTNCEKNKSSFLYQLQSDLLFLKNDREFTKASFSRVVAQSRKCSIDKKQILDLQDHRVWTCQWLPLHPIKIMLELFYTSYRSNNLRPLKYL